jgi:hypothetical protein
MLLQSTSTPRRRGWCLAGGCSPSRRPLRGKSAEKIEPEGPELKMTKPRFLETDDLKKAAATEHPSLLS